MTTKYKTLSKKQINEAIKMGLEIANEDVSLQRSYHSAIGASEGRRDTFVSKMVGKDSTIGSSGSVVLAGIATDLYAATGDKNDNVIKMWRQSLVRSTKVDQEDGSFKYLTFTWDKDDIGIIQSKIKTKKVKTELKDVVDAIAGKEVIGEGYTLTIYKSIINFIVLL